VFGWGPQRRDGRVLNDRRPTKSGIHRQKTSQRGMVRGGNKGVEGKKIKINKRQKPVENRSR